MRLQWVSIPIVITLTSLFAALDVAATPNPPTGNERIVYLRKDCGTAPNQQEDCFEGTSALETWLWSSRNPTQGDSVTVEVGPGEFDSFNCPSDRGWVTLRGAGRDRTVFRNRTHGNGFGGQAISCWGLEFIDLRFEGANIAFEWVGTGSSTWTDVDIIGVDEDDDSGNFYSLGWVSNPCSNLDPGESPPIHYFFGSRIIAVGDTSLGYPAASWWEECGETWFYGGEIRRDLVAGGAGSVVHLAGPGSKLFTFGTSVRLKGPASQFFAVNLVLLGPSLVPGETGGPEYHMHGGIMSAVVPNAQAGIAWGINNTVAGGLAHTPGAAWNFIVGGALINRLSSVAGATNFSPFLWQSGATPPLSSTESNVIDSQTGSGIFVETDCDSTGDCTASGGQETHLMIYNETLCGASNPWFDSQVGACRQ